MTKVREDDRGLYVIAGTYVARPGNVIGCDHCYRMDDAGLKAGDTVRARHIAGTQTTAIRPDKGKVFEPVEGLSEYINQEKLVWAHESLLNSPWRRR